MKMCVQMFAYSNFLQFYSYVALHDGLYGLPICPFFFFSLLHMVNIAIHLLEILLWLHPRTNDEAPILWPPDAKIQLIRKDPGAGKDWGEEEEGTTEDKMVGWHHQLNEYEFVQTLEDGEGQGSLVCYSPWGCKESNTTERLNNNIHGINS